MRQPRGPRLPLMRLGWALLVALSLLARPWPASAGLDPALLQALILVVDRQETTVTMIDGRGDEVVGLIQLGHLPSALAVAERDGVLVTADPDASSIHLRDLETGVELGQIFLPHDVWHFRLSPDERRLAVVDDAGGITLVDMAAPHPRRYVGGMGAPHNVAFSSDSRWLYVAGLSDPNLRIVDVEKGQLSGGIALGGDVAGWNAVTLRPGSDQALVTSATDGSLTLVDLKAERPIASLDAGQLVSPAYATASGEKMVVLDPIGETISVLSAEKARLGTKLDGMGSMTAAAIAWFDSTAFVVSAIEARALVVDLDRERLAGEIALPSPSEQPAVSRDGAKLYLPLTQTAQLAIIDAQTRQIAKIIDDVGTEPWLAYAVGATTFCH